MAISADLDLSGLQHFTIGTWEDPPETSQQLTIYTLILGVLHP
jgi:hypothetical protein